jgi:hypothetical protein
MNWIRRFFSWLPRPIIADVPPELDRCEECRRVECTAAEREACGVPVPAPSTTNHEK